MSPRFDTPHLQQLNLEAYTLASHLGHVQSPGLRPGLITHSFFAPSLPASEMAAAGPGAPRAPPPGAGRAAICACAKGRLPIPAIRAMGLGMPGIAPGIALGIAPGMAGGMPGIPGVDMPIICWSLENVLWMSCIEPPPPPQPPQPPQPPPSLPVFCFRPMASLLGRRWAGEIH